MESKIFHICIIALLVLIFGALLGILYSTMNPFDIEDQFLDFEDEDLEFFEEDHVTFHRYDYEQLSRYLNVRIDHFDDIVDYVDRAHYEWEHEEDELFAEKEMACGFDEVLDEDVCYIEIIEAFEDDDVAEITVIKVIE